ncbi:MAG: alpha/beta fold hydrolase [Candidatus Limnocylindrales bacterium]
MRLHQTREIGGHSTTVISLGEDQTLAPSLAVPDARPDREPAPDQGDAAAPGESEFITVRGIPIRYASVGDGKPLLLLHGWGSSLDTFDTMTADLKRFFRITAFDFPGHGASGMPPTIWTVDDFVSLTLDLMAELRIERPAVLGHSFGGRVAIKLAAARPAGLDRLILVDAAGVPPRRTVGRVFRRAASRLANALGRRLGRPGQAVRGAIVSRIASPDYLNAGPLRGTFLAIVKEDLTPYLSRIASPTLLVWGDSDEDTPVADARTMEKLIPGARLLVLKNAGHFSYLDQYGRFRLAVLEFLNG